MTAEIVHHHMDSLGCGIVPGQCEQHLREFESRAIRGRKSEMKPCLGLYGAENIGRSAARIFVVPSRFPSRLGR